ncbi:hypothetical protein DPMN_093453 [Dreissena polymorpha]|uniref:Uncharacterized protein n=1 Tax=Dreissena polymorpha TaxID=45954 RepID=A0A9D4L5I3_DREPO|nr:hypothetical protein DPMN_093453 [Dreissena polymorpha]
MAAADVKPEEFSMENVKLLGDNKKLKRFKGGVVYHQIDDIPNTDVVDADNSNNYTQHKNGCKKSVSIIIITFLIKRGVISSTSGK